MGRQLGRDRFLINLYEPIAARAAQLRATLRPDVTKGTSGGTILIVHATNSAYADLSRIARTRRPARYLEQLRREAQDVSDLVQTCAIASDDLAWASSLVAQLLEPYRIGGEWFFLPQPIVTWLRTQERLDPPTPV
jgi:hypothetical protein